MSMKRKGANRSRRKPQRTKKKSSKARGNRRGKPKGDTDRRQEAEEFPIVGIGASAGGFEAFEKLLSHMSADCGMALVLIPHLDPHHESLAPELLARKTRMRVRPAQDGMPVEPDCVYVIPPNRYLAIQDGALRLSRPAERRGLRMPIDFFFRSLAAERQEKAICIVLSGTGTDGTLGLKEVKGYGGMAMIQDPKTAIHDGMPRSALATGMADFVLDVEDMPETLLKYVNHPYVTVSSTAESIAEEEPLEQILSLLRETRDYDFRGYKKSMLLRRVHRRMGVHHCTHAKDYLAYLRNNSEELAHLFRDFLIGVTSFFRDPQSFEALQTQVIEPLVDEKGPDDVLRAWAPGCASGEEAYSIAMLALDALAQRRKSATVQVFASDIDEHGLEFGRNGIYPESIAADVPEALRERYFTKLDDDHYQITKPVREAVVFARQNVIANPPFSKLDLISCRNLMIYLEPEVQKSLVVLFHFALKDRGYLFLGSSETIGSHADLFQNVSKKWRIYRKIPTPHRLPPLDLPGIVRKRSLGRTEAGEPRNPATDLDGLTEGILLREYAPASVLVNRRFEVLFFYGPTGRYLRQPSGEPTHDLIALAPQALHAKLRSSLYKAIEGGVPVMVSGLLVPGNGEHRRVGLSVRPLERKDGGEGLLLVSFEDEPEATPVPESEDATDGGDALIRQLEAELKGTREDLQSTVEELESSNEELKGANEEVMSVNEELQSANEELETSKEELQSLNEELNTVNVQLQYKVEELEKSNNDLSNLLSSTAIATIFLDTELRIRRFTPAAQRVLRVISSDEGRTLTDISQRVRDPGVFEEARGVLRDLTPVEREVWGEEGECFIRRILPYRTHEDKIEGVVVTFTEITQLKRATVALAARMEQQAVVADLGRQALGEVEPAALMETAVRGIAKTLRVPYAEVLELFPGDGVLALRAGVGWKKGENKERVGTTAQSQAAYTLASRAPVIMEDLERARRFSPSHRLVQHRVVSGVSVAIETNSGPFGVLGAYSSSPRRFTDHDVAFLVAVAHVLGQAIQRKRSEAELKASTEELEDRVEVRTALVRLLQRVAVIANEAESVEGAFRDAIAHVCERLGWAAGHAYLPTEESGSRHWRDSGIWRLSSPDRFETLVRVSREMTFRPGEGLVGRVAKTSRLEWIPDVRDHPGFLRASTGKDLGITSVCAIPVLVGNTTVAVLEFFSADPEPTKERQELREGLAQLGVLLGRIVERKRSEARYRAVVEDQTECIFRVDLKGKLVFANDALVRGWKKTWKELRGATIFSLLPTQAAKEFRRHWRSLSADQPVVTFELKIPTVGSNNGWQEWTVRALLDEQGKITEYQGVGRDVGRRKETEERLRQITARLIGTEEAERRRLSRELHDDLNQKMGVTAVMADMLLSGLPLPEKKLRAELSRIKKHVEEMSDRIHWLAYELHPPVLEDMGLAAAFSSYGRQLAKRHGFRLKMTQKNVPDKLPADASACLFRVGQEALVNAAEHSETGRIEVRLSATRGTLRLSVRDFGSGFDPKALKKRSAGLGLRNMEERLRLLGGSLSIQSSPGQGTRIHAWLPLEHGAK